MIKYLLISDELMEAHIHAAANGEVKMVQKQQLASLMKSREDAVSPPTYDVINCQILSDNCDLSITSVL